MSQDVTGIRMPEMKADMNENKANAKPRATMENRLNGENSGRKPEDRLHEAEILIQIPQSTASDNGGSNSLRSARLTS
jgi:hypothetical protein